MKPWSGILLVVVFAMGAARADQVWDGGGTGGAFSIDANWDGDVQPTWGYGGSLWFRSDVISHDSVVADMGFLQTDAILWDTTFPTSSTLSYGSGGIEFGQRVENRSSASQTIQTILFGGNNGATAIELKPVNGDLWVTGDIYNVNSLDYEISGDHGKTLHLVTSLGVGAAAANVDFRLTDNTNVRISGEQLWQGTTTIAAGAMTLESSATLATSAIVVSGGQFITEFGVVPDTASVTIQSGTYSLAFSDTVGAFLINGGVIRSPWSTIGPFDDQTLTATSYALDGGTVSVNLGSGTMTVGGDTTLNGASAATVVSVNAGTLTLGQATAQIGSTSAHVTVATGAGIDLNGVDATVGSITLNGSTISGNALLTASSYQLNGGLVAANLGAGAITIGGDVTVTGTVSPSATTSVASGDLTVTALIGGSVGVATGASIGGSGTVGGSLTFGVGSHVSFDPSSSLHVNGSVTFTNPSDFGVDDVVGLSALTPEGTYTLIAGAVTTTGLANLGPANAYSLGDGKAAYFQQGSLQLVVVPEPSVTAMAGVAACLAVWGWRRGPCHKETPTTSYSVAPG